MGAVVHADDSQRRGAMPVPFQQKGADHCHGAGGWLLRPIINIVLNEWENTFHPPLSVHILSP